MDILPCVREGDEADATRIYCTALFQKLRPFFGDVESAISFLMPHLRHDRAVSAVLDGKLIGLAGFKHAGVGLFEPKWADFRARFGIFGGAIRVLGLSLLEKTDTAEALPMDGISVAPEARGLGAGTALLDAVTAFAAEHDYSGVRLDVIDTNPRARALYDRNGFVAGPTRSTGPLRFLFGFSSATVMVRPVEATMGEPPGASRQ